MSTHHKIAASFGIQHPALVEEYAKRTGLPYSVACALLLMESYGGKNIFGADPTSSIPNAWKNGKVTWLRYRYYKARRRRYGAQGVGPCQLTGPGLQDAADAKGGCHKFRPNILIGFGFLHANIVGAGHNLQLGFQRYNGSGPAAVAYGHRALALSRKIHAAMKGR